LATHALARRLTGSALAAYVAGIAFAYAPYRTSQVGHLQLYACWWLPLVLLSLHAYYEDGRARWLVILGLAWLLQGLTNGYYLLFTPVLIACWLAWFTRRVQLRRLSRVLIACGAAALAALPFLLMYYHVQTAHGLARSAGEMAAYSATPASFVSASPLMAFWHTREPITTEQYLFPGITALALAAAGLVVARRDRCFQFYLAAALFMAALSAGPSPAPRAIATLWHPYSWIAWLPGFSGLRVPARFYMLAVLCLAVAAGIAFSYLARRFARRPMVAALALVVFAGLAWDGAISRMPLGVPPGQLALSESGARVLALPFDEGRVSVFAMYQSMSHHLPVVNGYAGYIPSHADVIDWALRRRDPTVLDELRRGHALYVVVAFTEQAPAWSQFMDAQPGAVMQGIQAGGRVYRMPALPYAPPPRPGTPVANAGMRVDGEWIVADLGHAQTVRGLELRTHGGLTRLPASLRVEVSTGGTSWTVVHDERPGGAALLGALELPRVIPIRLDLRDAYARYVRVNASGFGPRALTILGPP